MAPQVDPALTPPPTVINDTHKHYDVAIAVIVMMVIATAVTLGRLFARWRSRTFGKEDWAMIPALLLYIGHSIMITYCNLKGGTGKPLWEVTLPEFAIWFKGLVASAFLYPAMTAAIRASILLFYLRIFGLASAVTRMSIWIALILSAVYVIIFSIIPGVICKPLSATWHPLTRRVYCKSDEMYYHYNVALYSTSLGLDIWLLLLPIYPVMRLQMSLKRRLGALLMFALGASACIAASYKLAMYVSQWGRTGDIDLSWFNTQMSRVIPPQWDKYGYTYWIPAQVEPTVAMIGSSLPALRTHIFSLYAGLASALNSLSGGRSEYASGASKSDASAERSQKDYVKMGGSDPALQTDYELETITSRHRDYEAGPVTSQH